VPLIYAIVALAGIGWAIALKSMRPQVYEGIGLGARGGAASSGFSAALQAPVDAPEPLESHR
jgi:hypothetical protein